MVAVSLFLLTENPAWLLLIPYTMLGRVYFGAHWFGDTVGGAAIGIMGATFVDLLWQLVVARAAEIDGKIAA